MDEGQLPKVLVLGGLGAFLIFLGLVLLSSGSSSCYCDTHTAPPGQTLTCNCPAELGFWQTQVAGASAFVLVVGLVLIGWAVVEGRRPSEHQEAYTSSLVRRVR